MNRGLSIRLFWFRWLLVGFVPFVGSPLIKDSSKAGDGRRKGLSFEARG